MSYELDYYCEVPCPCGKGKIVEESYSNDWMQIKQNLSIACTECKEKYHIEYPYLVPKEETLCGCNSFNIYEIKFSMQLCLSYTLDDLMKVKYVLNENTTYSKISDERTRHVIRQCKAANGTMRMSKVREDVSAAIRIYNNLEINYEKDKMRISNLKKRCIEIIGI